MWRPTARPRRVGPTHQHVLHHLRVRVRVILSECEGVTAGGGGDNGGGGRVVWAVVSLPRRTMD
jgi:hypothetical protein